MSRRCWPVLALIAITVAPLRAAPNPKWTDRAEYDLALAIRTEAAPQKRLQLLDQWKAKYPASDQRQTRRELYLATYQSLGDTGKMMGVAREMMAEQPTNFVGLYWCALLTPQAKEATKETLEAGDKAARGLLSGLDRFFDAGRRPAMISDADWRKEKESTGLMAHRTAGWIAWQRGDYAAAGQEFAGILKQTPANGEISSWYGTVLSLEKKPEQQVPALWHLARGASLKGEGAMPERRQRQIAGLLERLYVSYHGDSSGLEQLTGAAAAGGAMPPADLKIESAAEVAQRKFEEELERTNPQLAAWVKIRKRLESADGAQYFETLKTAALPRLKGTLIRFSPPRRPNELVLGLRDPATPEVLLRLDPALTGESDPGAVLEFEGMPVAYSLNPFTMVIAVDRAKLDGWGPAATRPQK
jgi:hypothetical protein